MDNASKNAGEMIGRLQMQYNRGRQAAITNELVDIITGSYPTLSCTIFNPNHTTFVQVQVLYEQFIYCAEGRCAWMIAIDCILPRYYSCSATKAEIQSFKTSIIRIKAVISQELAAANIQSSLKCSNSHK